jgi:putative FmdB family regulatory protein
VLARRKPGHLATCIHPEPFRRTPGLAGSGVGDSPDPVLPADATIYTEPMPIYDYVCSACGDRIERLQRHSDGPPSCPECGEPDMRRAVPLIAGLVGSVGSSASAGCGCGGACACGARN